MTLSVLILICLMGVAPEASTRELLARHCLDCHESPRPKAGLDLEAAFENPADVPAATWSLIELHLRGRTMPPSKIRKRPDTAEYQALIAWVESMRPTTGPRDVTLRRLNETEYQNTIRDLFGIEFDADAFFPDDDIGYGFDTIGDVLTMSPLLTERYLDAAERIAADVVRDPGDPRLTLVRVEGGQLRATGRGQAGSGGIRMNSRGGAVADFELLSSGPYRIRYGAWGQQAGDEPVRLAVRHGGKRVVVHEVPEVASDPGVREVELDLPAGQATIEVVFINDYFKPDHPDPSQRDRNAVVTWIELEGPLDQPIVDAFQSSLPSTPRDPRAWIDVVLADLLPSLWRGPVAADDRAALVALAVDVNETGASREQLLRSALTAALVSPRFLYRLEALPGSEPVPLEPHELATRMSYFIWSSTPPEWLMDAAERGLLASKEGRLDAVTRLLEDPKSVSIARNFATQWLQIRDLPDRTPDPARFPGITRDMLESMQLETILFFDEILREDYPLEELFVADFTFMDDRLAAHYGLDDLELDGFTRVALDDMGHRGGLLNHAGIMTATSNPTRTSIVKRGKWVLEALLDQPPPPPPPGVDGLAEDGGDTTASLREQMERHRADPSCAACHARMDALGFALEPLDAVGRWRDSDESGPVDARGELPDGRIINGPEELRDVLVSDPALRRSLVTHMLIYALGRGLSTPDEPAIESLLESLREEPSLRRLVTEIVELDIFRMRTASLPL